MNQHRLVRECVNAGVLDGVVLTVVADLFSAPEQSNDFDRLFQHFLRTGPVLRPALSGDVLVQIFAGADPEKEPDRASSRPMWPLPGR